MHLSSDSPIGRPSFELSEDQLATVVNLLCLGAAEARRFATSGMLEVPITIQVCKSILRVKKQLGLSNLQIVGEFELLDIDTNDSEVLGRIDIILQFLHQFGDEEAYVAVECKRVAADETSLNRRYVTQGVNRFVTGQYASGHHWGVMLGYVLKMPVADLVSTIDARIRASYGEFAKLIAITAHANSLSMHSNALSQGSSGHVIHLLHVFVDMTTAAPVST